MRNCSSRAGIAGRGHNRYEHWRVRGRRGTKRPVRAALRHANRCCGVMSCRRATSDTTAPGSSGLRYHQAFGLIAPPAPTTHPGANINATASLQSVNYMVNHICQPIQSRSATSSGSDQTAQDGDRAPLTLHMPLGMTVSPPVSRGDHDIVVADAANLRYIYGGNQGCIVACPRDNRLPAASVRFGFRCRRQSEPNDGLQTVRSIGPHSRVGIAG